MKKKLIGWVISLAMSVAFAVALLFAINFIPTKKAFAAGVPFTVSEDWASSSTTLAGVRESMLDPESSAPYAEWTGSYTFPDGTTESDMLEWVKFYSTRTGDVGNYAYSGEYSDSTALSTLAGSTIYIKVSLPTGGDPYAGDFVATVEGGAVVRQEITPTIKLYDTTLTSTPLEIGYTGSAIQNGAFEIVFEDSDSQLVTFSGEDVTFSVSWFSVVADDRVDSATDVGAYNSPVITLSGADADKYEVQQDSSLAFSIVAREIKVESGVFYTNSINHPIIAVRKAVETAWESAHSAEIAITLPNFTITLLDDGRDYITAGENYNIQLEMAASDSYVFVDGTEMTSTSAKYAYSINKKTLYVSYDDSEMLVVFGESLPNYSLGISYEGFVAGEDETDLTTAPTASCGYVLYGAVGTYTITVNGGESDNYQFDYSNCANKELTVNKRPITVTITSKSSVYGDNSVALEATVTSGSLVNGRENGPALYTLSCDVDNTFGVGTYNITGTTVDTNYDITFNNCTNSYEVTARPITVTITSKSSTYGESQVALEATVTYTGDNNKTALVNGRENNYLLYTLACSVTSESDVGLYNITGTPVDGNYAITFANSANSYEVTARPITVTITSKSSTYGESQVALEATVTSGSLVNGRENGPALYTLSCDVDNTFGVGTYNITGETVDTNYNITFENTANSYEVTARPITVTITSKSSTYGESQVALAATVTNGNLVNGRVNGSDLYTLSCEVDSTSSVGTYDITGEGVDTNYAITFVNATGSYEVTPRQVTITITNVTSAYGSAIATFSDNHSEVLLEADRANWANFYSLNCYEDPNAVEPVAISASTPVGTYNIIGVDLNANDNYEVTFENESNSYEITKATIAITNELPDISEEYGDAPELPELTYEGYVNGENSTTAIATVTWYYYNEEYEMWLEYSEAELFNDEWAPDVGTYHIKVEAIFDNYEAEVKTFDFTVTKRTLSVTYSAFDPADGTFDSQTKTYTFVYDGNAHNAKQPAIGNTYKGRTLNDEELEITFALAAQTNWQEGGYTYTVGLAGDGAYNYKLPENSSAKLVIEKREVELDWIDDNLTYNGQAQKPTVNVINKVENDVVTPVVSGGQTDASATAYTATATLDSINYKLSSDNPNRTHKFTIGKKALTITANDKTITYGAAIPNYDLTYDGFVPGEDATVLGGAIALNCPYVRYADANTYAITPSGSTSNNYQITFIPGTLTVNKKAITVTIVSKTSIYGEDRTELAATDNGIVNSDYVYSLACSVTSESKVGTYDITGKSENDNYIVTFENETDSYTVYTREITIDWSDLEFTYDGQAHKPTATAGNLVNDDEVLITVTVERVESDKGPVLAGTYRAVANIDEDNYKLPQNYTKQFVIKKPSEYVTHTIDEEAAATEGVDVSEIFKNVDFSDEDAELELKVGTTTVVFDSNALEILSEYDEVVFTLETKQGNDAAKAYKGAEMVFEISLSGATFENGKATVTADFENKAPTGKVAKVYYVGENGKLTNMHATFKDGKVSFNTNHFSTYIIKYEISLTMVAIIIAACIGFIAIVALIIVLAVLRKKRNKKNKTKTQNLKKDIQIKNNDTNVIVNAEVVSEPKAKTSVNVGTKTSKPSVKKAAQPKVETAEKAKTETSKKPKTATKATPKKNATKAAESAKPKTEAKKQVKTTKAGDKQK